MTEQQTQTAGAAAPDGLKAQAGAQIDRLTGDVRQEVARRGDDLRTGLSDRVHKLSEALLAAKAELDDTSPLGGVFDYAAENADALADSLRSGHAIDSLRDFARDRPAVFLGVTAVAGFAAARFLLAGVPAARAKAARPAGGPDRRPVAPSVGSTANSIGGQGGHHG